MKQMDNKLIIINMLFVGAFIKASFYDNDNKG